MLYEPIQSAISGLSPSSSVYHGLADQAGRSPEAPAILAPGRTPLPYGRLLQHIDDVVQVLRAIGVDQHEQVALALPNGPEMAVACLAVSAGATCAPLNPAGRAHDFAFYLSNLSIKALMIQSGIDAPARVAAQAHAIPIIELSPVAQAEAGLFTLQEPE